MLHAIMFLHSLYFSWFIETHLDDFMEIQLSALENKLN